MAHLDFHQHFEPRCESPLLVVLDQFTSTRSGEATASTVTRQSHNTDRGRMNQGGITTVVISLKPWFITNTETNSSPLKWTNRSALLVMIIQLLVLPETNSQLSPLEIGLNAPKKGRKSGSSEPSSISRCKPAKVRFRVPGIFRRWFFWGGKKWMSSTTIWLACRMGSQDLWCGGYKFETHGDREMSPRPRVLGPFFQMAQK